MVGLYRSGTTLTEQILASHPAVHDAGELPNIRGMTAKLMPHPRQAASLGMEVLRGAATSQLAELGAQGRGALRVVDKHPDNIFSLGLIALLFPKARVVVCHRDPRDNVRSCHFQRFSEALSFSNDLADCGKRWIETERLAQHWRQLLPISMLDLQYETLVGDVEGQARRLITFLDLEWHPACLSFHETNRTVNTPSAWAVRQPIYQSSVGRWRNYERHLGPLFDGLTVASRNDMRAAR